MANDPIANELRDIAVAAEIVGGGAPSATEALAILMATLARRVADALERER